MLRYIEVTPAVPGTFENIESALWQPPVLAAGQSFSVDNLPRFEFFIARSGPEGERWVAEYFEEGWDDLRLRIEETVRLMRNRCYQPALDELAAIWEEAGRLSPRHPERQAVLGRWYFSATAYHRYLTGDPEGAAEEVGRGYGCVEEAIRQMPALLPFAQHCIDFYFHHARVARARRQWGTVQHYFQLIRALADDLHPLCQPGDEPLYMSTVDRHILGLPLLTSEEHTALTALLSKEVRVRSMVQMSLKLYAVPGFVIPYP